MDNNLKQSSTKRNSVYTLQIAITVPLEQFVYSHMDKLNQKLTNNNNQTETIAEIPKVLIIEKFQ